MAVVNKKDESHDEAAEAYRQAVENGLHLYSSRWTWYDALSHLKERAKGGGLEAATKLQTLADGSRLVHLVYVHRDLEERAVQLFWDRPDKAWSITTCANVLLMRDIGLQYVLSKNTHYNQAGLQTLY